MYSTEGRLVPSASAMYVLSVATLHNLIKIHSQCFR